MRALLAIISLVVPLSLAACAGTAPGSVYAQRVLGRPVPAGQGERRQECAWIGAEAARQRSFAGNPEAIFAEGIAAVEFRAKVEQDVMALESRAATLECGAGSHPG